jgi:hypothetical protein
VSETHDQARSFVTAMEAWMRSQPVADLLPRERITELISELRADDAFWEGLRPRFETAWARGEKRLRGETRAMREVLSPEAAERILDGLERVEPDPEAVRTFLRSPAIESMLGEILYHGISEFMKKADLLGRFVGRLPVLGPLRKKVMKLFSEEVEGRLEGQLKGFLGQFSGKAVERMIDHVLSDANKDGFRSARRRLGEHLLDRPVQSLVPNAEASTRARDQLWEGLRRAAIRDEDEVIQQVYEDHGADAWGDWTWKLSARATELFAGPLARFLHSEGGSSWTVQDSKHGEGA